MTEEKKTLGKSVSVRAMLESEDFTQKLKDALGSDDRFAARFRQVALMAALQPELREATPTSVCKAVLQLAAARLLPDGRQAALTLYRRGGVATCEPVIMYVGMLSRIRATGLFEEIYAEVVRAKDTFRLVRGTEGRLEHVIDPAKDSPIIGAYAFARYRSGGSDYEYMALRELEEVRSLSKGTNTPWNSPLETVRCELYKKVVLRRLAKRLPVEEVEWIGIERADNASYSLSPAIEATSADKPDVPEKAAPSEEEGEGW